ncbi:MAG: sigma factor-like helix-turn-helix DNA-binding protein, partial [Gemmataceae bacterium]
DAVKKRTQRALRKTSNLNGEVADGRDGYDRIRADERDAVRRAARQVLSRRQQQIVKLSFEGWTVQEIASEMKLPAERVSDEKYKAIRKLRAALA